MSAGPEIENQQAALENGERAVIVYDGQCEFCRRSLRLLRRLDWLHRFSYADARNPGSLPLSGPALEPARLLEEMHLVTPDGCRVYHGFKAVRWIAWRLPLLWAVAPFLYLPGMTGLGQRVYLWIARHRFQLVPCHGGVCTLPGRGKPAGRSGDDPAGKRGP